MGILKGRKPRSPPWPPYPAWSSAKWWGFLRAKLRNAFTRWPPKYEVLTDARRKYTGKSKQQKWEFRCNICKDWYKQADVEVDHIVACGPLKTWEDLPVFAERLFCSKEGLQVVCKTCHRTKTNEERNGN